MNSHKLAALKLGTLLLFASGTDKITLRVARSSDTKKFARLKVAITP